MTNQTTAHSDAPVLVVGAGPTGLTMASELLRHGVPCRLIDREAGRHTESRATDLQARTLEVFDDMGVVDAVLARGVRRTAAQFFADGKSIVRMPFEGVETPYCAVTGLAQCDTERLLEEHFDGLGGRVERSVQLATLAQDRDGVRATLLYPDGHWREERFDWVVGCDGAHSAVRHALGFAFDGNTFKSSFFLADVCVDWEIPHDEMAIFSSDQGMVAVIGMPGEKRARVFGDLDEGDEPTLDLDHCHRLLAERSKRNVRLSDLGWTNVFHVHSRMVEHYRRGRAFVVGDAAHIHSPVGGHGLNFGVQDAYNLAWKLALVARGKAQPSLLDSYQIERRPAARALLDETAMETQVALWRGRLAHHATSALFKILGGLTPLRRRFLTQQMEIDIDYAHSPLSGEHASSVWGAHLTHPSASEAASVADHRAFVHGPRPGRRAPDVLYDSDSGARLFDLLRGPHHTLLLFDGDSATDAGYQNFADIAAQVSQRFGGAVRTHAVVPRAARPAALDDGVDVVLDRDRALHGRYGAGAECAYLVRPDGHVGFRSQPADCDALCAHLGSYMT